MFKEYESKPIMRLAHEITDNDFILAVGEKMFELQSKDGDIEFVAYEQPEVGDYVVFLNDEDVYHCNAKVFEERNIV